jgi:hypothetical protein
MRQLPDHVDDATTALEETLGPQRRIAEETFESRVNVVETGLMRHWPVSNRILNLSAMPDLVPIPGATKVRLPVCSPPRSLIPSACGDVRGRRHNDTM